MTSIQERVRPPVGHAVRRRAPRTATDDELLERVHAGSAAAFAELYERHRLDAHQYARRLSHRCLDHDTADDAVAEAVRKVLTALRSGHGPTTGFRQYLFTAIRTVLFTERAAPQADDDTPARTDTPSADEHLDVLVVMSAFSSLPERWRQVLWATEVTDLPPSEVAPLLGLRANSVAALALRAREALRIAFVRAHLPRSRDPLCRDAIDLIARQAVLPLTPQQTARLDEHVATCDDCLDAANGIEREVGNWESSWLQMKSSRMPSPMMNQQPSP